ncbi:MAG: tetratricopeptide repeat protein [Chloroflexota bacterium]
MQLPRTNRLWMLLALVALLALLALAPPFYQANQELQAAETALRSGAPAEAAQHLANAARRQPWRGDLWEQAGHYAVQAGQPDQAILYLEQAGERLDGGLTRQGWLDLGDARQQQGDTEAAVQAWEIVLSLGEAPTDVEVTSRLLQAHRALGDYPAALRDAQALVNLQPGAAQWQFQLGMLLAITPQPLSALDPLRQAAELDSGLAPVASRLEGDLLAASLVDDPAYQLLVAGRSLANLGEWGLAAEAFHQAILAYPDYAEAWAYLGEARQHLPVTPSGATGAGAGLAELEKALALDQKSLAAHMFLALYWSRQGETTRAEQILRQAIELYPQQPILQVALGDVLTSASELDAAYEAYLAAVEMAPGEVVYLRRLASFSLSNGYLVEEVALPVARQVVILAPRDAESLDLLAQVFLKLDDLDSARRFLEHALLADPNYAPAYLHLGRLHLLRDEQSAAVQAFQKVYELAPGSPLAEQAQDWLKAYIGGGLTP